MLRTWFNPTPAVAIFLIALAAAPAGQAAETCGAAGAWFDPDDGVVQDHAALIDAMAQRRVVLLGEVHDRLEQHRWQLHTLAALHGRQPAMAIGLEMLPRAAQPALDEWIAGALSVEQLLERIRWSEVWGFDPDFYLPVFHFARQNRVPMIALNVDREVIARVADEGLQAVPAEARQGVGDPAPASADYRDSLARIYAVKGRLAAGEAEDDPHVYRTLDEAEREQIAVDPKFEKFVEAQTTWDRAMAEPIAARLGSGDGAVKLVVALVGRGHAEYGHGIPHQLADLGVAETAVLLTARPSCDWVEAGVADAVFVLGDWRDATPRGPRLGVMITTEEGGVVVKEVSSASVAEATGLAAGDVIVEAAGTPVSATGELIAIVQRQAPGTWLPLVVQREAERLDLVAKFPTTF